MTSETTPTGDVPDDAGRDSLTKRPEAMIPPWELGFGVVLLITWFAAFAIGSFVPSADYRGRLLGGDFGSALGFVQVAIVVILTYTLTNIFFLVSVASALGCMLCRWRVSERLRKAGGPDVPSVPDYPAVRVYLAAFLRGFLLYLLAISGLLVLSTEQSVAQTTQVQYIRIGGLISALGFASGFDPNLILKLMGRVTDFVNQPIKQG